MAVAQRAVVRPAGAAGLDGSQVDEHPVVGPDVLLEPHRMVDARAAASDERRVLLAESRAEVGQVRQSGPVQERVVAERGRGAHPDAVGEDPGEEVGRRHLAHLEQRVPPAPGRVLGLRRGAPGSIVEDAAVALGLEGRDHGEDHLALLDRDDVAGGEGAPVPVAVDLQDDGQVAAPGPEEVAVERVRETIRLDGGRRGEQALGRHLPSVQGLARPEVGVAAAEQVAVDPLEVQQRGQILGEVEFVHGPPSTSERSVARRRGGCSSRSASGSRRWPRPACRTPPAGPCAWGRRHPWSARPRTRRGSPRSVPC